MKNSERNEHLEAHDLRGRVAIVGLGVNVLRFDDVIASLDHLRARGGGRVCFANVHMVMEAHDDPNFAAILETANLVVPDGMPLVWMQKLLGRRDSERVRGNSVMVAVLRDAAEFQLKVGFYGGSPEVLELVKERTEREFPGLAVTYAYSPPFRALTADEDREIIRNITASEPDILFVGLGCPKQEFWMAEHREPLSCVMLGVGAAFDFYAGTVAQSPEWLSRLGLEWLFRLAKEPRRLWRRYLSTNPRFIYLAVRQLVQARLSSR